MISHFEDIEGVHDIDEFVGDMRKSNTTAHIKTSFAIHLEVAAGVVTVRSKPRMMACVAWSEPSVLYDANATTAKTPSPEMTPSTCSWKKWPRLPFVMETLNKFYSGQHTHPVCIGPNAKREMLGFLRSKYVTLQPPTPPKWINWNFRTMMSQESTLPNDTSAEVELSDSSEDSEESEEDTWAPFGCKPKRVRRVVTSDDSEDETVDHIAGKARLSHLIGRTVAKAFNGGVVFRGEVVKVVWVDSAQAHMLSVRYSDGDMEDMTASEVLEHATSSDGATSSDDEL